MDNIFLAKILKEHARLIIPGFGAFLRKEGLTTALVFSPFLKKDDGVLCGLLCQEYGVNNFDGEGMIAEWVQHIREALASNGKYHIEGVGLLVLDANGAIAMVEEPARKPSAPVAQPVATPAPAPSPAPVQARPLVQPEPVAAAAPVTAQATIAQQIVEQIQQTPARPMVTPQPIGQATPRVAPRPISTPQGAMGGVNPATPQGMGTPPRPAAPINPNNPRPVGAPQGAPHGAQSMHSGAPRPAGAPQPGNTPQGAQGHAPQRPQGAAGTPPRPGQRPPQRPGRKQKKYSSTEIWLIVAIVAALVVTGIIIWSLLVLSPKQEFYTTDQVIVDSTTMVDTLPATNAPTPAN